MRSIDLIPQDFILSCVFDEHGVTCYIIWMLLFRVG